MHSRKAEFAVQPGEPVFTRVQAAIRQADPLRLFAVTLQLALLVYLARKFHLETPAFRSVMALTVVGFVIHHLLPMAMRLPFFVVLSLGSLVLVVGVEHSVRLVGAGVVLIGLCHLPIRFGWRLTLIGVAAAVLIVARAHRWFTLPGYEVIWPILGSMFMFRLIIYLYDLKNRSAPFGIWRALAYFFMLPNVCFPMYPLVDYQTFNRTYFDEPTPWRTYQVGIQWIFRGMIHLLLYRLVSLYFLIGPESVVDAGTLARYMVATYSLYLLISGQFHVIVGLLHLFGFNLPETHHLYFLSSSFTDFWRRINIYWKDFVLKIFFNPMYFKCKKWGPTAAMIIATLVAFFFTWLLHSYQGFWIRGQDPVKWQDAVFWGTLALLVLVNALYEQRFGRSRAIKGRHRSPGSRAVIGLKTIATFCVMTTLWCLWTFQGESWSDWLTFMGNITRMNPATALWLVGALLGIGVASALLADVGREYSPGHRKPGGAIAPSFPFWRSAALTIVLVAPLSALGAGLFAKQLTLNVTAVVADLKQGITVQDRAERDQGYYEDLANTKNFNPGLWELYNRMGFGVENFQKSSIVRSVPDQFHLVELTPSHETVFRNVPISTNRWAFRDRDYEKQKPKGVYRVALLGSSISMGWGVLEDQTYENVLEDRLNREYAGRTYARFESLNFAIGGYKPFQKLWMFERVLEFEPDAVIYEIHASELEWLVQHLSRVIKTNVPIPYPELQKWLHDEGLDADASGFHVQVKLNQMAPELFTWMLQRMHRECDQRGIDLYVLFVPRLDLFRDDEASLARLAELTDQIDLPALDLTGAYDNVANRKRLRLAPWDDHPNAEGHQLLADELYEQMITYPYWREILGLDPNPADAIHDYDVH